MSSTPFRIVPRLSDTELLTKAQHLASQWNYDKKQAADPIPGISPLEAYMNVAGVTDTRDGALLRRLVMQECAAHSCPAEPMYLKLPALHESILSPLTRQYDDPNSKPPTWALIPAEKKALKPLWMAMLLHAAATVGVLLFLWGTVCLIVNLEQPSAADLKTIQEARDAR